MKVLTAIVVGTILISGCARNQAPERNQQWRLIEGPSAMLEDRGDSALSIISWESVSPNGEFIVLTDGNGGNVAVYRLSDGKLTNFFHAGQESIDTLAASGVQGWSRGTYLSFEETGKTHPEAVSGLKNSYAQACFENDSTLLILGDVKPVFVPDQNTAGPRSYIDHRMFIECISLSNLSHHFTFPEERGPEATFARRGLLLEDKKDGGYLLSVTNHQRISGGTADSAPTIALYDGKGRRKANICFLPHFSVQSGLGYNLLEPIGAIDSSGEIVVAYGLGSNFQELRSQKTYEISALKGSNDNFFSAAMHSRSKWTPVPNIEDLASKIQSSITSLEVAENGNYEFTVRLGVGNDLKWEVVEYSPEGDLLRESYPFPSDLNVKFIAYQRSLKAFVCITASENSEFILKTYRWE